MTGPQSTILVIAVAAAIVLGWGRWRADLVAVAALCLAMVSGVLDPREAFGGFADPGLVAVAGMMVIGAAVREAGLFDAAAGLIERLPPRLALRGGMTGTGVAIASALMTGPEAVESFMPAMQATARQTSRPVAPMLAALVLVAMTGSTILLAGSVPALLVSSIRQRMTGSDFAITDLALPAIAIAIASVAVLSLYWRRLASLAANALDPTARQRTLLFTSEVAIPAGSSLAGQSIRDIERVFKSRIAVEAVIHEDLRRFPARPGSIVNPGDILVVSGELGFLRRMVERLGLAPAIRTQTERLPESANLAEAVVTPASPLVGQSQSSSALETRFGLSLLAVGRHGHDSSVRLRRLNLRAGDVLVFQGPSARLRAAVSELGCLVLDERRLRPGGQPILATVTILAGALLLAAFGKLPLAVALLTGVVLLVAANGIGLAELYATVRWPLLVQIGALLPIGAALTATGVADLLAKLVLSGHAPPLGLIVPATLGAAIVIATAIRAVPAVVLLSPFAFAFAKETGQPVDALLAAIVFGCSCDLRLPLSGFVKGPPQGRIPNYSALSFAVASVVVLVGSAGILLTGLSHR